MINKDEKRRNYMNTEWSLDSLYKGYDDPGFSEDMEKAAKCIEEMNEFSRDLSGDREENLKKILRLFEDQELLFDRLYSFCGLKSSVNTNDMESASYLGKLMALMSNGTKAETVLKKYISETENVEELAEKDPLFKEYKYYIEKAIDDARYQLSDEVEEALAKMNISGGDAWENLQSSLTSNLKVDYDGKTITLSDVRNLAYDPDPEVRKKAYDAEIASYEKIKEPVAFSLNSIKKETLTFCELRGFESPLEKTLHQSRMKKETLDALLEAMEEYMPMLRKYLKYKGRALGHENGIPWYDIFAPMGDSTKKYTIEEAKQYLKDIFDKFNPRMSEVVETAFSNEWIDFYPREGKVGGAFCSGIGPVKEFRVLTNFDGSFSSVDTLAHELGHGYHDVMIQDHRPLNWGYSMPVAETASTFNENVVMNEALKNASSDEEKLSILESILMEVTQIICDIYSRFTFEKSVFDRRNDEFMSADQLCGLMKEAQKKAFGDAVTEETLNPFMWVCKSHYYSSHLSFYNFPYAFGGLFARGLYLKAVEGREEFLKKYNRMLEMTPVLDVEEAAMVCGIDLTKKEFWLKSLESYTDLIEEYGRLTER
jgi:pepF/M3 family oligoendopeptidase